MAAPLEQGEQNDRRFLLFLGAGASAFAGYRTFATFPDLLFDNDLRESEGLSSSISPPALALLREIQASLESLHRPTTHDQFLATLSRYSRLWSTLQGDGVLYRRFLHSTFDWARFAHLDHVVNEAVVAITEITIAHYSRPLKHRLEKETLAPSATDNARELAGLYAWLADLNHGPTDAPRLDIFTTNYDVLVEGLYEMFPDVLRGLEFHSPSCEDDSDLEDSHRGAFVYNRLHGSTTWFCAAGGGDSGPDCCVIPPPSSDAHLSLCVLYPGKESCSAKGPHLAAFRRFHRALYRCNTVVFIGFSFRDDDVMDAVLDSVTRRTADCRPLELIVVAPEISEEDVHDALKKRCQATRRPPEFACDVRCIRASIGTPHAIAEIRHVIEQLATRD